MNLSASLLTKAFQATLHHGYGTFFPAPPELEIIKGNWQEVVAELTKIDLDTYKGYNQILSFAPKSRLNVRRVGLLHPYDFIFYTALVLALKTTISKTRLPANRVFSYRTEGTSPTELYASPSSWKDYRGVVETRAAETEGLIVGVTDIADFFPRVYHHRLVNALEAAADSSEKDYIRVLEKMLARFSSGTSYGIPVGPPASRLLGEAVLIDVDSTLLSFGIDFIRFVDDYIIFAHKVQDAEYGIRVLGETLFKNHGLTLQTAKTKISTAADYVGLDLTIHSEEEEQRRRLLQIFGGDYEIPSYDELDADQKKEIDAFNLSEMLTEAMLEGENVDFREVHFILGRLATLRKPELIPIVIDNLERLYPIAESVAAFFKEFRNLPKEDAYSFGEALLSPILKEREARPSEYYSMWMLSVFQHHGNWGHAEDILKIFRETSSDAVRRFAALALATSGTRAEALGTKEYLASASSLCRTAILLASAKLGKDERKYFKTSLQLTDSLEKFCMKESL